MSHEAAWNCHKLLSLLGITHVSGYESQKPISDIAIDSRSAVSGGLFIALQGHIKHGVLFAKNALEKGVLAIACDAEDISKPEIRVCAEQLKQKIPIYWVKNLRKQLGWLASCFYGEPSKSLKVIGVTGTNGKSSCVHILSELYRFLNIDCGVSGTLGIGVPAQEITESSLTTPDVVTTQRHLSDLKKRNIGVAVMEVSSHALMQNRVQGVEFDTAIFANLSHDHQDYHGNMEQYFLTKKSLLDDYGVRHVVINGDDDYGQRLLQLTQCDKVVYSLHRASLSGQYQILSGEVITRDLGGAEIELEYRGGGWKVRVPFFSSCFISNLLACLAVLLIQGISLEKIVPFLKNITLPRGRMERVVNQTYSPAVFIDYAHTPDALKSVLGEINSICTGRLWCVFGCGGNRDKDKRALMGQVAESDSDIVILTSDNPRDESPIEIIEQVQLGFSADSNVEKCVIEDRAEAIRYAVLNAASDDVILVAGKGHEDYQILANGRKVLLNEKAIIKSSLEERA